MPVRAGRLLLIQKAVVRWFRKNQRDLPWRHTRDPYAILVSEVMLQQTQVDRVIPKYTEFLRRFPTVRSLAGASPREVLLVWAGMGYNRRALYLHRLASDVTLRFGALVPTDAAALQTLPGVGAYTAAAVATFSTGLPHALADTNVKRVTARVFLGLPSSAGLSAPRLLGLVAQTMPRRSVLRMHPSLWGHALMDFGALICKARPRCAICPLQRMCKAWPTFRRGKREGERPDARPQRAGAGPSSTITGKVMLGRVNRRFPLPVPDRIYRGRIVQRVREADPAPVPLSAFAHLLAPRSPRYLRRLVQRLVHDGLLEWTSSTRVQLPRGT